DERFVRGTPFIQGFTRGVNGHLGASQFLAIGGNRRGGFKFIQCLVDGGFYLGKRHGVIFGIPAHQRQGFRGARLLRGNAGGRQRAPGARGLVERLRTRAPGGHICAPAVQVAICAKPTQKIAKVISEVAVTNPRLRRRRVTRHSHHWASSKKITAASRPDSGTHCGAVKLRCSSATRLEVIVNSREAAGRISSRIIAEALDIYAADTALDMRWLARAFSTMPVYTGSSRWIKRTNWRISWSSVPAP